MKLTTNELQFMNVLWKSDTPLTSADILKRSVEKTWKDASLHTILKKLLDKGAIIEHGFCKDGKAISRTFVPALSYEDYYASLFSDFPAKSIPRFFSALVHRSDFDDSTMQKLEEILKERYEELKNDK